MYGYGWVQEDILFMLKGLIGQVAIFQLIYWLMCQKKGSQVKVLSKFKPVQAMLNIVKILKKQTSNI